MSWLAASNPCPGLFYGTPAQDGTLIRIRVPGGILNRKQAIAILELSDRWQTSNIQVTNRANLQFRAVRSIPTSEAYTMLQSVGLAAKDPELDHLRNIMTSPTAGIDPSELIDVRSIVQAIDDYIQNTPELIGLPPKFSIGIDGGGTVGIGARSGSQWQHRYNEIQLSAISRDRFKLTLGSNRQFYETNVETSDCLGAIAALSHAYLEYVQQSHKKKPRMRDLLKEWGIEGFLNRVPFEFNPSNTSISEAQSQHLGIQPQKQSERSYIGIALKLGWMSIAQLKGLIQLAETYGSGELRLTPWQSILLPDIPTIQAAKVLSEIKALELSTDPIDSAIVACAGKPGCAASETHTQIHALELMKLLEHPMNIHITGCNKGCAQPSPAELTLLGTTIQGTEAYSIYAGDRLLTDQPIPATEISSIAHLINTRHD
ncbi:precorrin-3B synthase [Leptolyngbya sp. NIES-2104]|uniref:precorrin-3B synthase n=1 Tax=Leptolyngbya sp. NIES-2104 TaxID=1552121 RepID=UPI0006EC704A|nr:precorrin-3B synthase [Leptolyngbya sp. NIES-2104]GAP98091.1 cobalamin biosynthesis protein CobG [Leptolyngbya sp. NIES-2104]